MWDQPALAASQPAGMRLPLGAWLLPGAAAADAASLLAGLEQLQAAIRTQGGDPADWRAEPEVDEAATELQNALHRIASVWPAAAEGAELPSLEDMLATDRPGAAADAEAHGALIQPAMSRFGVDEGKIAAAVDECSDADEWAHSVHDKA